MIDQKAQDTLNTAAVLSPQEKVSVNSPDAVQAAFSQIPKEYQGMVKSSLQSLSSPGGTGQALSVTSGELSSLPPEYRNLIQASLDKMPLSTSKPEEKN